MAIKDLEQLLAVQDRGCTAATFKSVVAALSSAEIPFVVSGVIAYGVYAKRARATSTIDLLAHEDSRTNIVAALTSTGLTCEGQGGSICFQEPDTCIEVVVSFAQTCPARRARASPTYQLILGVSTPVIKLVDLAWSFCLVDDRRTLNMLRSLDMLVQLINQASLNTESLRDLLESAGDSNAEQVLAEAAAIAEKEKHSSYAKSVEARLARRS